MATSKPRFTVTVDPEVVDQIEEFRHSNRITTQSKAVQRLLQVGLGHFTQKTPNPLYEAGLDRQERELIQMAQSLDPERKAMLLRIAAVVADKDRPYNP